MIEMILDQRKDAWIFTAFIDGSKVAELTAYPYEDKAVIHNAVYCFNKELLSVYRQMFNDIRGVLRKFGIFLVIACADRYTPKIGKWWRMMGFKLDMFGSCTVSGKETRLAVMEA